MFTAVSAGQGGTQVAVGWDRGSTVQRHKEQTVGRRPRVSTFATEAAERVFHESAETIFKHPQDRLVSYQSITRIILA